MSLFLKIFLWFWLAMALIVGVFFIVSITTQNEPLQRQWRVFVAEGFNLQIQTAAQIYENEGKKGLDEYLSRMKSSERVVAVAFFDHQGQKLSGDDFPPDGLSLLNQAMQSEAVEFDNLPDVTYIAKKVRLRNNKEYAMISQLRRPPPSIPPIDRSAWFLRIAAIILTSGLVCYGLARYLTSPVSKLREATRQLAAGDLTARIRARRHDEIGKLAEDFNEMAERIELLVTQEKRLTQDISHELRSPLARLNVALELAKQKTNAESQPILERIEMESKRLNEMISRLLMLSKLESGAGEIEKRHVNLQKLVEQIVEDADFEAKAKGKNVKIVELQNSSLSGSENLLRSAVENVLRNAVRYTGEDSSVEVSLKNSNDSAVISVRDFGQGIPENELEKIFRPFYRIGEARERKAGGVGLGLAIAERAVYAHKGTIKAKNTGDGLLVEIRIPFSPN